MGKFRNFAVENIKSFFDAILDLFVDNKRKLLPQELADIINTSIHDFMGVDVGFHTDWDLDYLYEFFCCVKSDAVATLAQKWIVSKWKADKKVYGSYSTATDNILVQQFHDFENGIVNIRQLVATKRQEEKELEELKQQMLLFEQNTNETKTPHFVLSMPSIDCNEQFHMSMLRPQSRSILHITDDQLFSLLVNTMRNDVWPVVDKNKGKYCDVVRFIFEIRGIVDKNVSRNDFDDLLHDIIPNINGSLVSSMKRRSDTINGLCFKYYDCPALDKNNKYWQLRKDGKEIEDLLEPVLQAMNASTDA